MHSSTLPSSCYEVNSRALLLTFESLLIAARTLWQSSAIGLLRIGTDDGP